jgi:hypothetical protein
MRESAPISRMQISARLRRRDKSRKRAAARRRAGDVHADGAEDAHRASLHASEDVRRIQRNLAWEREIAEFEDGDVDADDIDADADADDDLEDIDDDLDDLEDEYGVECDVNMDAFRAIFADAVALKDRQEYHAVCAQQYLNNLHDEMQGQLNIPAWTIVVDILHAVMHGMDLHRVPWTEDLADSMLQALDIVFTECAVDSDDDVDVFAGGGGVCTGAGGAGGAGAGAAAMDESTGIATRRLQVPPHLLQQWMGISSDMESKVLEVMEACQEANVWAQWWRSDTLLEACFGAVCTAQTAKCALVPLRVIEQALKYIPVVCVPSMERVLRGVKAIESSRPNHGIDYGVLDLVELVMYVGHLDPRIVAAVQRHDFFELCVKIMGDVAASKLVIKYKHICTATRVLYEAMVSTETPEVLREHFFAIGVVQALASVLAVHQLAIVSTMFDFSRAVALGEWILFGSVIASAWKTEPGLALCTTVCRWSRDRPSGTCGFVVAMVDRMVADAVADATVVDALAKVAAACRLPNALYALMHSSSCDVQGLEAFEAAQHVLPFMKPMVFQAAHAAHAAQAAHGQAAHGAAASTLSVEEHVFA